MSHTKLTATHNEQTFTRRTTRDYSHVVIGLGRHWKWESLSWCSRFDLAKKKVAEHTKYGGWLEVQIIEVNNPA